MERKTGEETGNTRDEVLGGQWEAFPWGHPAGAPLIPVRAGWLRGSDPAVRAHTDGEAVAVWLNDAAAASGKTREAYRREAERLLLWIAHKQKSLSEVERADLVAYYEFLGTVPKHSPLVTPRVWRRSDVRWRPFTKPLSENARRNSQMILSSLFGYLTARGWLLADPLPPIAIKAEQCPSPLTRSFADTQTDAILSYLRHQQLSATTNWQRLNAARDRWIFVLCIHLALRAGDYTNATMGNFKLARRGNVKAWEFHVIGRGQTKAVLPVTQTCIEELKRFRAAIGLDPLPAKNDGFPVAPDFGKVWAQRASSVQGIECHAVCTKTIYRRLKAIFAGAGDLLMAEGFELEASQLRSASPHWLRHTSIRDVVLSVSDLTVAQEFARHSNCNSTARYASETFRKMHEPLLKRRSYQ